MAESILKESVVSTSQERLLKQIPAFQHSDLPSPSPSPSPSRLSLKLCGSSGESEAEAEQDHGQQNSRAFRLQHPLEFVSPETEAEEEEEEVEEVEEEEEVPREVEEEPEPKEVEESDETEHPEEIEDETELSEEAEEETEHPEEVEEEEEEEEEPEEVEGRRRSGALDDSYDPAFESDRSRSISPYCRNRSWEASGDLFNSRIITQSQDVADIEAFQNKSMGIPFGVSASVRSSMFHAVNNSSKFEDLEKKSRDDGRVGEGREQQEVKRSSFVKHRKRNVSERDGEEEDCMYIESRHDKSEKTGRFMVNSCGKEETRPSRRSNDAVVRQLLLERHNVVNLDSKNVQNDGLLLYNNIERHNAVNLGLDTTAHDDDDDTIKLVSKTPRHDNCLAHETVARCNMQNLDSETVENDGRLVHKNFDRTHVVNLDPENTLDDYNLDHSHVERHNEVNLCSEIAQGDDIIVRNHMQRHDVLDVDSMPARNDDDILVLEHLNRDLHPINVPDNDLERRKCNVIDLDSTPEKVLGKVSRGISSFLTAASTLSMKNVRDFIQGKDEDNDHNKREVESTKKALVSSSVEQIHVREKINVSTRSLRQAIVNESSSRQTIVEGNLAKQLLKDNERMIRGKSSDIKVENVDIIETGAMDTDILKLIPATVMDVVMHCSGHLSPPMPHDPDLLSVVIGKGVCIPLPFRDCTG